MDEITDLRRGRGRGGKGAVVEYGLYIIGAIMICCSLPFAWFNEQT